MTGTILNAATILAGGALGLLMGSRLPERLRHTVVSGLGLFTLAYGVRMFFDTKNSLVVLVSLLIGVLLGEWWQVEEGLRRLGTWLENRFANGGALTTGETSKESRFVRGFVVTSLLFVVGPMAILGSIQDGLSGNFETLAIKSVLDGFASLAFASSFGVGVLFSAVPVFIYQGAITLLAAQVNAVVTDAMMVELTATGGVLLMGIAIGSLLEIRPIRVGNMLPALLIAPFAVAAFIALGIY